MLASAMMAPANAAMHTGGVMLESWDNQVHYHMGCYRIDAKMGQGRDRDHGGDQIGRCNRYAHAKDQGGKGNKEDGYPQIAVGQFDNDVGKGEH